MRLLPVLLPSWACVALVSGVMAAKGDELFAPPVGTELDYHIKISNKQGEADPMNIEIDQQRVVLENDGLVAKLSNQITATSGAGTTAVNPVMKSPESYLIYRLYILEKTSNVVKLPDGQTKVSSFDLNCDKAAVQSLLPLGHTAKVTVPCTISNSTFPSSPGTVSMTVYYEGKSVQTTPAGKFSVANIRSVWADGPTHVDNLAKIDTDKGLLVSSETQTATPAFRSTSVTELTKIK